MILLKDHITRIDIYSKIGTKMQRMLLLCDKLSNIIQWKEWFVFMKHLINSRTQTTHLEDKNGVKHSKNIFLFVKSYNKRSCKNGIQMQILLNTNSITIDDY